MSTTVCDLHVAYLRPKYNKLREWLNDPDNVYVGRNGRIFIDKEVFTYPSSFWQNPFPVKNSSLEESLNKYYQYLCHLIQTNPLILNDLAKLKGKNLGCWCVKTNCETSSNNCRCHAQIILHFINHFFLNNNVNTKLKKKSFFQ